MGEECLDSQSTRLAKVSDLYNSSPAKIRPWIEAAGGIPSQSQACKGGADSTHGIPEGSWLIMQNAPDGLKPRDW